MERADTKRGGGLWNLDHLGHGAAPGPERRDAARNRRAIVEAARMLFDEHGVTRVTMEQVAKAAGVGKGTLYRRFPNKGQLCQALLDVPTRTFQEETMRLLGERATEPLDRLDVFLDRLAWFTEENLDLLYGGNEPLCGADRISRYAHPAFDWRRWTVLSLLREAERNGELDPDLDLEYIAAAILTPLDLDFFYYQRRVQEIPVERISAGLRSLASGLRYD